MFEKKLMREITQGTVYCEIKYERENVASVHCFELLENA